MIIACGPCLQRFYSAALSSTSTRIHTKSNGLRLLFVRQHDCGTFHPVNLLPKHSVDFRLRRFHATIIENNDSVASLNVSKRFISLLTTRSLAIMGASIAALASSIVYMTHNYFEGVEGIQRAASFYSLAIPKYIIYRYHQFVQSPDHVWEQLDQETSQQGLDIILRLKGFYIKCGQMCASNIGNAFPVVWQETMSILQDQVPPEDFDTVILPIIQSELPNYQEIFSYISPIPIGSASIGQVHRAKMIIHPSTEDRNRTRVPESVVTKDVVIKICYPHVERLLRGDVRTIRTFCEIAQPVHVPAMREVEKQFVTEFDYVQEANNLYEVRSNLIRARLCQATTDDDSRSTAICTVPYPYRQYCTKRVLVMEEIHGDKLVDVLKRDGQRWMEWASKVKSMKSLVVKRFHPTYVLQQKSTNDIYRSWIHPDGYKMGGIEFTIPPLDSSRGKCFRFNIHRTCH